MSDFELRPRFRLEVTNPENEVVQIIRNKLKYDNPEAFESTVVHGHLILRINEKKKHFWSPQMDISIQSLEEGGSLIRCLMAPEPAIWTMFMFFYATCGFGAFIGLMLAMSQWTLERDMWGIYLFFAFAALGAVVHIAAQSGKRIASDEMRSLSLFINNINWNIKNPEE